MSKNKSKIDGYDGPLGWPNWIGYGEYLDITTESYTREDWEADEVTLKDDEGLDLSSNDSDVQSVKGRQILAIRYQIDAYWEQVSSLVVQFASTYGAESTGTGELNIKSQSEYDEAVATILKIQGYISVVEKLYETLLKADTESSGEVTDVLEGSDRNRAAYEVRYDATQGKYVRLYHGESGSVVIHNDTTTEQSYQIFEKYNTWATNVLSSLKSQATVDGETGEAKAFYDYEGDYPRSVSLEDRNGNLQQFREEVYMLDRLMAQRAIRSVWVFLQIGNMKFSTWDQSNYITDFDYKKNGSGCANSFTFNLAYSPSPGDKDINKLEKILSKRKVFFQYGYNEQYDLCSPQYEGEILQYSVSTENNMIKYSLVGYSELSTSRFVEIESWPGFGARNDPEDGEEEGQLGFGIQATVYAAQLLETYLSAYNYKVVNEAINDDQPTDIDPTEGTIFECAQKILAQAVLTDELQKELSAYEKNVEELEEESGVDISNSSTEETAYFTYVIDDKKDDDGKKTVTIIRSKKLKELNNSDINISVAFAYGGCDSNSAEELYDTGNADLIGYSEEDQEAIDQYYNNVIAKNYSKGTYQMLSNMIINFSTSYDGAVTMTRSYIESSEQLRVNSDGELVSTYAIGNSKATTGDTRITDEKYSYWLWEQNTMYSYDATLTMLGVPADIPIGTYIYIKPIVNGYEHHTGGYYYITGSEDKVTSEGYTTTLKLLRVVDQDTDEVFQGIKNLKKLKKLRASNASRAEYIEEVGEEMGDYAWKDARVDDAFDTYSASADPRTNS